MQKQCLTLVDLYTDLQALKHLPQEERQEALLTWAEIWCPLYPGLSPWEFSAAAGSTLGVFMLIALSSREELQPGEIEAVKDAYFPFVAGLHILLDYLIDQEEDLATGDLNFVAYYRNEVEMARRLGFFFREARKRCALLPEPIFHRTVLKGLLALYLSDNKADGPLSRQAKKELLGTSPSLWCWYLLCQGLRRIKKI